MNVLATPALPLHSAGKYVAGAYVVFVALVLIYVAIMARRLSRTERDLAELKRQAHTLEADRHPHQEPQEREALAR
jgi:flagellar biosynthesis/type III secretory pathway M-ring protein FliF/YscJ